MIKTQKRYQIISLLWSQADKLIEFYISHLMRQNFLKHSQGLKRMEISQKIPKSPCFPKTVPSSSTLNGRCTTGCVNGSICWQMQFTPWPLRSVIKFSRNIPVKGLPSSSIIMSSPFTSLILPRYRRVRRNSCLNSPSPSSSLSISSCATPRTRQEVIRNCSLWKSPLRAMRRPWTE